MPATFVASSTSSSGGSNVTSLGALLPSAWRPGLFALWVGIVNDASVTITLPAGWTLLGGGQVTASSAKAFVAAKTLAAGELPPTFTLSAAFKATTALVLYSGVSAATPYQASAGLKRAASQATTDAGPVTTTADDQTVAAVYLEKSTTATSVTDPAGTTRRAVRFGVGSGQASALVVDKAMPTPASSGVLTATYDAASSNGYGLALALVNAPPTDSGVYQLTRGVLASRDPYLLAGNLDVALPAGWDAAGVTVAEAAGITTATLADMTRTGLMPYRIASPSDAAAIPAREGVAYRITGQARTALGRMRLAAEFHTAGGTFIPHSLGLGAATDVDPATFTDLDELLIVAPPRARRLVVSYGLAEAPTGTPATFEIRNPAVAATQLV